jgi:hypothetical protein
LDVTVRLWKINRWFGSAPIAESAGYRSAEDAFDSYKTQKLSRYAQSLSTLETLKGRGSLLNGRYGTGAVKRLSYSSPVLV